MSAARGRRAAAPRLLVLRRGGLGDTLLLVPLLRALRRTEPAAELHVAGTREFVDVLREFGAADVARSSEDLHLWDRAVAPQRLAGYAQVIGDDPAWAHVVLQPTVVEAGRPLALQLVQQAGLTCRWPEDLWLCPPRAPRSVADGPIVLAPGSGARTKCWPREHWLALAASLVGDHSVDVVVGPVERERDDPRSWPFPATVRFCVEATVVALAHRLQTARSYVGNDSGPTHLAAMLGVPTAAIFGATDPAVWAPVGPHVRVLGDGRGFAAVGVDAVRNWIADIVRR